MAAGKFYTQLNTACNFSLVALTAADSLWSGRQTPGYTAEGEESPIYVYHIFATKQPAAFWPIIQLFEKNVFVKFHGIDFLGNPIMHKTSNTVKTEFVGLLSLAIVDYLIRFLKLSFNDYISSFY